MKCDGVRVCVKCEGLLLCECNCEVNDPMSALHIIVIILHKTVIN